MNSAYQLIFRVFIAISILFVLTMLYVTRYDTSRLDNISNGMTRVGFDLFGGAEITLSPSSSENLEAMDSTISIIGQRVSGLGFYVFSIHRINQNQIIIMIPNVMDVTNIPATLVGIGRLEFIDTKGQFVEEGTVVRTSENPDPKLPQVTLDAAAADPNNPVPSIDPVIYQSITDGRDLDTRQVALRVATDSVSLRPAVSFAFIGQSANDLATFTAANIQKPMCIVLDNTVVSCPIIQSALVGGSGEITTNTREDAEKILNQLKYGSLPMHLQVVSINYVPANANGKVIYSIIGLSLIGILVSIVRVISHTISSKFSQVRDSANQKEVLNPPVSNIAKKVLLLVCSENDMNDILTILLTADIPYSYDYLLDNEIVSKRVITSHNNGTNVQVRIFVPYKYVESVHSLLGKKETTESANNMSAYQLLLMCNHDDRDCVVTKLDNARISYVLNELRDVDINRDINIDTRIFVPNEYYEEACRLLDIVAVSDDIVDSELHHKPVLISGKEANQLIKDDKDNYKFYRLLVKIAIGISLLLILFGLLEITYGVSG